MYIPKQYGESQKNNCPFCGKLAVTENHQGVPVCLDHKKQALNDVKCICGEYLDVRKGKFGPYFNCINCGNVSFNKGLSSSSPENTPYNINTAKKKPGNHDSEEKQKKPTPKKETIITSDEVDIYY